MKQTLTPKLQLSLKHQFNQVTAESLQMLSYSNEELKFYLQEQAQHNPYLSFFFKNNTIDNDAFLSYAQENRNLHDEIMEQVNYSKHHPDKDICEYLILQLDSNGYFPCDFQTLVKNAPFNKKDIKRNLTLLRSFEPHGLFAFNLRQCLQIQCGYAKEPASETAYLLCDYLEDLALHHYNVILESLHITMEELQEGYEFLKTCNPKPAANYQLGVSYMDPEFRIYIEEDHIHIQQLHDDFEIQFQPINDNKQTKEIQKYMQTQRQQAKNLISSLKKRQMTLMQIMQYICDVQADFFLKNSPLKHLTLEMISNHCGFHISTVSRSIQNKTFEYQGKYYAMKSMLCHGGSKETNAAEIKKIIKDIIENENKEHPYSDESIRMLLAEKGIHISRRAVSKYRESMYIYNSTKRKIR